MIDLIPTSLILLMTRDHVPGLAFIHPLGWLRRLAGPRRKKIWLPAAWSL